MTQSTNMGKLAIPGAIVIAGGLIAVSLFMGGDGVDTMATGGHNTGSNTGERQASAGDFRLPSEEDHVRGNPDAAITIVEYSDLECPFCARLHPTLERVVEEQDDVKWVYRHFPLSSHRNAIGAAVASECVARLGGNDAFWSFVDAAFANQNRLGESWYASQAQALGIDAGEFVSCQSDQEVVAEVGTDFNEVRRLGGGGTPYSVVVDRDGNMIPFSGALSYAQVMSVISKVRTQ